MGFRSHACVSLALKLMFSWIFYHYLLVDIFLKSQLSTFIMTILRMEMWATGWFFYHLDK